MLASWNQNQCEIDWCVSVWPVTVGPVGRTCKFKLQFIFLAFPAANWCKGYLNRFDLFTWTLGPGVTWPLTGQCPSSWELDGVEKRNEFLRIWTLPKRFADVCPVCSMGTQSVSRKRWNSIQNNIQMNRQLLDLFSDRFTGFPIFLRTLSERVSLEFLSQDSWVTRKSNAWKVQLSPTLKSTFDIFHELDRLIRRFNWCIRLVGRLNYCENRNLRFVCIRKHLSIFIRSLEHLGVKRFMRPVTIEPNRSLMFKN